MIEFISQHVWQSWAVIAVVCLILELMAGDFLLSASLLVHSLLPLQPHSVEAHGSNWLPLPCSPLSVFSGSVPSPNVIFIKVRILVSVMPMPLWGVRVGLCRQSRLVAMVVCRLMAISGNPSQTNLTTSQKAQMFGL